MRNPRQVVRRLGLCFGSGKLERIMRIQAAATGRELTLER